MKSRMRRLFDDRGEINFLKIFLLLAVVSALYLGWIYAEPTKQYFDLRHAVKVACNQAYVNRSEDAVRESVMRAWKDTGVEDSSFESDGTLTRKPTPFDRLGNLDVTLTKDPPQITVGIHYTQHIAFPYLNRETEQEWKYEHTEDLNTIKW